MGGVFIFVVCLLLVYSKKSDMFSGTSIPKFQAQGQGGSVNMEGGSFIANNTSFVNNGILGVLATLFPLLTFYSFTHTHITPSVF